jgi:hypothetical protein
MSKKETYIRKRIVASSGGSESSSVELQVEIKTGESELIIEKTIREFYPVTDYDKVIELHENLTRGGGRRCYSLEDLTK